jgi:hypothetical protein
MTPSGTLAAEETILIHATESQEHDKPTCEIVVSD